MATQPHQSPFLALELSRLQLTLGMEESQPRLLFHKPFSGDECGLSECPLLSCAGQDWNK